MIWAVPQKSIRFHIISGSVCSSVSCVKKAVYITFIDMHLNHLFPSTANIGELAGKRASFWGEVNHLKYGYLKSNQELWVSAVDPVMRGGAVHVHFLMVLNDKNRRVGDSPIHFNSLGLVTLASN